MIQKAAFANGGFVLHKIQFNGQTYSAWYDKDGKLLDAERKTRFQHAYSVGTNQVKVREQLQKVGHAWK